MFSGRPIARLLFLTLICLSVVYGHDEHEHDEHEHEQNAHGHKNMDHAHTPVSTMADEGSYYFSYPEHRGLLYTHILTMCIGWIFIMPVSCVLAISGSRYHFPAKLLFLATHGVSAFLGFLYDKVTPDLYPNNSYRKLGWAIVWVLFIQSILGAVGTMVRSVLPEHRGSKEEMSGFIPVSMNDTEDPECRPSGGSGQGTEEYYSSRSPSTSSVCSDHSLGQGFDLSRKTPAREKNNYLIKGLISTGHLLSRHMPFVFNSRVVKISDFGYSLIERFLAPLGFVQICLGVVTGSGIFMGDRVFNGLAHFIKGGIFFLYGIITLGRWLGALSELGWAWNIKPPREFGGNWRELIPSAEMIESTMIFLYGCSNVFLEHLASAGGAWSHGDLEHVSIAFMFIGGGLCGILIESKRIRDLLNYPIVMRVTLPLNSHTTISPEHQILKNYSMSYNPIPALIFFILGIMMSKHHQALPLSSTIHSQWGVLLSGFSIFRLLTYVLLYLSPPTSYLPSRPPTEIVGSFCLVTGGLLFMASNKDTVSYLDRIGADPMFILTVIIGIAALLMCWATGVMAIKAWALRHEQSEVSRCGCEESN